MSYNKRQERVETVLTRAVIQESFSEEVAFNPGSIMLYGKNYALWAELKEV